MSDETNEQSVKRMETELADEADRMETRLEEFDDHVEDAKKKAEVTREHAETFREAQPDSDSGPSDPLGEVVDAEELPGEDDPSHEQASND